MRKAVLAVLLLLLPATAQAAEKKEGKDDKPKPELNMSPIGLPVISGGRIVNNIFVSLKLDLDPKQDPVKLHGREPFLRDQIVRQAFSAPFNTAKDLNHFDDARLKGVVMADAKEVFGPGVVKTVEIVTETAQSFVPTPKPAPKPEARTSAED